MIHHAVEPVIGGEHLARWSRAELAEAGLKLAEKTDHRRSTTDFVV
jgi:hypothetical protein